MIRSHKGFTILEILIGVAILSGMSLMIYGTMGSALGAKVRIEKKDEMLHSVRISMDKMVHDLHQAFMAKQPLEGRDQSYRTGFKGGEDSMNFTTFSHLHYLKNAHDTDQVSVGYFLKSSENGLFDLVRRESQYLSDKIDEGGHSFSVVENVKEFKLEYFDSNQKTWLPEWDSTQIKVLGRLPEAVRITIVLAVLNEEEERQVDQELSFTTVGKVDLYDSQINF